MKLAIKGVSAANLDAYTLTVEGKVWNGRDLMPLYRGGSLGFDGTNFTVYINVPFDVQAATVEGTTAADIVVIDNSDEVEVKNLVVTSALARFTKGKSYLISNASVAPTTIIPAPPFWVAGLNTGNDSAVHASARYLYNAMEEGAPLGNSGVVDAIAFDVDIAAMQRNASRKAQKKAIEQASFWSATNH